jgi:hypothetical protein
MEILSGPAFIELLKNTIDVEDLVFENYDYEELSKILGDFTLVDEQIGDIGNTGYCHCVWFFSHHNLHLKSEGWVSSYTGDREFDDSEYELVKETQKTITVWESI